MYHNRHTRLIALLVFLVQLSQYSSPILPAYIFIISSRVCVRLVCVLSGLPLSHQHSYPTLSSALNIFFDSVFLLLLKMALFGLKQVLSNFYAIGFLWRRCNFRGKCRARYCDVVKTTCGIRRSNYLPLLLYRIPLRESGTLLIFKVIGQGHRVKFLPHNILVNTLESTSFNGFWLSLVHT